MIPKTISASAVLVYEGCPSRFHAEYVLRARDESNSAADLGTVCHAVLERWVKDNLHLPDAKINFTRMQAMYVEEYFKLFSDTERYEEGLELLQNWYNRQDFWEREVVSTESKENFKLPVTLPDGTPGEVQFTYIMDRLDLRDTGDPECVDYKTIIRPMQPEDLKHKIQPRAYAVATQLLYPDAERVWVTFDLLRYQPVGVAFTKEENRLTWMHLQGVAQRIIDDNPTGNEEAEGKVWPAETVNAECKYCIRKAVCKALTAHDEAGGLAGINLAEEPERAREVIDLRSRTKWRMEALKGLLETTEAMVLDHLEAIGEREAKGNDTKVSIRGRSQRKPDVAKIKQIVGPNIFADYAKIGVKDADTMIREDARLDDSQKKEIKAAIHKQPAGSWLQSDPISDFEERDE